MNFDPSQYETVKERKKRFYADHHDGRIIVAVINLDLDDKAVIKASVFLNKEDQARFLPRGEGYALELRDKTKPLNKYGKEYESVNFSSWLENAEESAVGRALDNAGYASNAKCSLDEMQKAKRNSEAARPAGSIPQSNGGAAITQPSGGSIDGDYRVTFGKHKGKTLIQIGKTELASYIDYITKESKESNKPISGPLKEFIESASRFLTGVA